MGAQSKVQLTPKADIRRLDGSLGTTDWTDLLSGELGHPAHTKVPTFRCLNCS